MDDVLTYNDKFIDNEPTIWSIWNELTDEQVKYEQNEEQAINESSKEPVDMNVSSSQSLNDHKRMRDHPTNLSDYFICLIEKLCYLIYVDEMFDNFPYQKVITSCGSLD